MFLKRIEIIGFKSFARRTVLDFQEGVTVIVGPNGCGKSNVFDAMRWVLGEQRVKSLRASKMCDVIFNGTAQIKPSNVAQVSLVIDNRSSLLPVEVKEIVITRRLFRDGESHYLINRVPCRLRDIHELFMDTGIGTTAYSMMEQGQVDFIINAKPLERREIFDEAAGIAKYKARKAEALRKLERTTEDLLRLSDVIAEVKRTLNSLKRQAAQARRYKELREQRDSIDKILLCRRSEQVTNQLTEVRKRLEERQDSLYQVNTQMAKLEALWQEAQVRTEELQEQISESQSAVFSVRSELEQMRHKCEVLHDRIDEYTRREKDSQTENESLSTKIKDLNQRAESYNEILQRLENEVQELEEQKTAKEEMLRKLLVDRREFDETFQRLNQEVSDLLDKKNQCLESRRSNELQKNKYDYQLEELEKDLANAEGSKERLETNLNKQKGEVAALEDRINALTTEFERLKNDQKNKQQELERLVERHDTLREEIHGLKAEERVLQDVIGNYEGYNQAVKEIMRAAREGELSDVIDVLTGVIEVDADIEPAIESALAEKLQYILVKDLESCLKTIEFLDKKSKSSRAVIMPCKNCRLNGKNGGGAENQSQLEGVVGKAIDFIRCAPEWNSLLSNLLNDTLLVKDRDAALRLASTTPQTLVTRDGSFIIGSAGEIIVGNGKTNGRLLGRRRKLAVLKDTIAERSSSLEDGKAKVNDLRTELSTIEETIKKVTEQRNDQEITLSVCKNELQKLQQQVVENELDREKALTAIEEVQAELEKIHKVIEETTKEEAAIGRGLDEVNRKKHEMIESTTAADEKISELKNDIHTLHTDFSLALERKKSMEQQSQEVQHEIEEMKRTIHKKGRELKQLGEDRERMIKELADTTSLIETREVESSECTRRLNQQETELQDLQTKSKEWHQQIQTMQRDRIEIENDLNDQKVKVAELKTQMDYFDQQSQEKFHIGISDLQKTVEHSDMSNNELQEELTQIRQRIDRIGSINPQALEDYERQNERYEFLTKQQQDLIDAKESLEKTIKTIDSTCLRLFNEAFSEIRQNFVEIFRRLFGGGRADLNLTESDDIMEAGIEIVAQPPGKKLSHISLLSGGERALTAIALMFALFLRKPSPFCILDEIDAPLDDSNVELFKSLLKEFVPDVHFVIVTHNKRSMMLGTTLYGVTMEEPGVSKIISLSMEEIDSKIKLD